MDIGVGVRPVVVIHAIQEQERIPQPAVHQVLHHCGPLVAPGSDGVDDLRFAVLVAAVDEVGAEAVFRVDPLRPQVVGQIHHGVELVLGDGDAVVHQQGVDPILHCHQRLPQQLLRLPFRHAAGVVRRVAEGAVAYVPRAVVAVGHGAEVLVFLNQGHALVAGGKGLHRQGRRRQHGQHQQHT